MPVFIKALLIALTDLFLILTLLFPKYGMYISLILAVSGIFILLTVKGETDMLKNAIRRYGKKPCGDYFVLFIELANLYKYSRFYDLSVNGKISEAVYRKLLTVFKQEQVVKYGLNYFIVICPFTFKDTKIVKIRYNEQYDEALKIKELIEGEKFLTGEEPQYYTAALNIGAAGCGNLFPEKDIGEIVNLAHYCLFMAEKSDSGIYVAQEQTRIGKRDLDSFSRELEKGFLLDEFNPYFIPIVNPENMQIVGCESLVRWNKDKYRIIEASKFKEIAEEKHLFDKIDLRVIHKTFECYKKWREGGLIFESFRIVLNISRSTLTILDSCDLVSIAIGHGIKPQNVELDLSFDGKISAKEMDAAAKLKDAGFRIALEADISSLTLETLSHIPYDTIKLRGFSEKEARTLALNRMLARISITMNRTVLAKAIEDKNELAVAKAAGANLVEGFYFTKPLAAEGFEVYLTKYIAGII